MLGQQHCTAKSQAELALGERACAYLAVAVLAVRGPSCLLLGLLLLGDYHWGSVNLGLSNTGLGLVFWCAVLLSCSRFTAESQLLVCWVTKPLALHRDVSLCCRSQWQKLFPTWTVWHRLLQGLLEWQNLKKPTFPFWGQKIRGTFLQVIQTTAPRTLNPAHFMPLHIRQNQAN